MNTIDQYIKAIYEPQLPAMFNPWSQICEYDQDHLYRQIRLKHHLLCSEPKLIITGEAAGLRASCV